MPPSRRSRAVSDLSDPSLDSGLTVSHDRVFKSRLHRFPTPVLLRIGFVPRPARLCWLAARKSHPVASAIYVYIRFGKTGPCRAALAGTNHSGLQSSCQAKHRHACPLDSFDGRGPGILVLDEVVLNLRSATSTRVSQESLA